MFNPIKMFRKWNLERKVSALKSEIASLQKDLHRIPVTELRRVVFGPEIKKKETKVEDLLRQLKSL